MVNGTIRPFTPPGPVARAFMESEKFINLIMGPYGSAKTSTALIALYRASQFVPPSPADNVIHARSFVIRDTYANITQNVMSTFWARFPREGEVDGVSFTGGKNSPGIYQFQHYVLWRYPDGSVNKVPMNWTCEFRAIGEQNAQSFCDGLEGNNAFCNGMDALPFDLLKYLPARISGRWPEPMHRGPQWADMQKHWRRLFADFNPPEEGHPLYDYCVNNLPSLAAFFRQPGGLDEGAENLHNLAGGRQYYLDLMDLNKANGQWWVDRFVHNKFGYSRAGKPVFEKFDSNKHATNEPLKYNPHRKLYIGLDAGGTPAAVALQMTSTGRIYVLSELISEGEHCGGKQFSQLLKPWLRHICGRHEPDVEAYADPSAAYADQSDSESNWIDMVSNHWGVRVYGTETNALSARLEVVRQKLVEYPDGEPALLVSTPNCPILRKGFENGYIFKINKTGGMVYTSPEPFKNCVYSHVMDALQYALLGASDWQAVKGRPAQSQGGSRVVSEYDIYAGQ